jgi:Zn finger protein HypA/HybF involved in hydrogenase expression
MKVKMTCLNCGSKYILKLDTSDISGYACGACDSQEFDVKEMESKDD